VAGIDRDRTKIAEDRRVVLFPRARAVLARQLRLRETLQRHGRLNHDHLFFLANGAPIRRLHAVYRPWQHTLRRLAIRYRKPYAARHSSVSWSLMTGRNPLRVAQQHRHSLLTMLVVYAAWTEGSLDADIAAIRRAMRAPAYAAKGSSARHAGFGNGLATPCIRPGASEGLENLMPATQFACRRGSDLAIDLPIEERRKAPIARNYRNLDWRSGRDSNESPGIPAFATRFATRRIDGFVDSSIGVRVPDRQRCITLQQLAPRRAEHEPSQLTGSLRPQANTHLNAYRIFRWLRPQ
jgi:hypothetical protein